MVKNIFSSVCFLILFSGISGIIAGPERYDHLEAFKQKTVTQDGPKEEIVQDESGQQVARATYKYNDQKQISEIHFYTENKEDGKNLFIYDDAGLKQEELFDKDNKLIEKIIYTRNEKGEVVEFEVFDENNSSIVKWKFQYKKGVLVSGTRFVDGEASERFTNEYTETAINQSIFVDNNEKAGTITATLKDSKIIKRVKADFTGTHTIEYEYDGKGRIEKMKFYSQEENNPIKLDKTHIFNYSLPGYSRDIKVSEK